MGLTVGETSGPECWKERGGKQYHWIEMGWGNCIKCTKERREVRTDEEVGWGMCTECWVNKEVYQCRMCDTKGIGGGRSVEKDKTADSVRSYARVPFAMPVGGDTEEMTIRKRQWQAD